MAWEVEHTYAFERWWDSLARAEQRSVATTINMLKELGPTLRFPRSSGIIGSTHSKMRELRIQHLGEPYRVLYAFDPRRVAVLLIGGTKGGDGRWYDRMIPFADKLFSEHLRRLVDEDLING